jgi:hypothetical protein
MLAFEQWCHDARLASDRDTPDTSRTPHTSPGESRFLHLCLATSPEPGSLSSPGAWRHRDLLITDLQGEVFERVRDSSEAAARMRVFARADHFVQLLDGAALHDPESQHVAIADAQQILRSCIAAGVLTDRTVLHLVVTKWDLMRGQPVEAAIVAFAKAALERMTELVQPKVADVRHHVTSARAAIGDIDGWGALGLVTDWVTLTHQIAPMPLDEPLTATTEYDRYAGRAERL